MSWNNQYPFGLHGYHKPSKQTKKLHDTFTDPLKLIPDDQSDPLNLVTPPPEDPSARLAAEEEERKTALRQRIDRLYGVGSGAEAEAAKGAMQAESTKLGEATRQYYTDQLGDQYKKAERSTRFKLARQGLLGGSEDVNQQGEVKSDRDLGATRVDDSVRRAIATLTSQREQERLNSISLVNAGGGDSAVSAAQAGLRNSFENVSSQQKTDIFSDLFSSGADGIAANNLANNEAALAARYRERLGSFFPSGRSSTSGRVTASS